MMVNRIELKNVSMEFPSIFTPVKYNLPAKSRYSAIFSFTKSNDENINTIRDSCKNYSNKLVPLMKDGDNSGLDIFTNKFIVKCNNLNPPIVLAKDGTFILDQVDELYNSASCNIILDIWENINAHANEVCATLVAIRLLTKG